MRRLLLEIEAYDWVGGNICKRFVRWGGMISSRVRFLELSR